MYIINEENHMQLAVANEPINAIKFLIENDWLLPQTDVILEEEEESSEFQWLEQVIPLWEALGCEKMEDCTKDFILNYFKPLNLHQTRAVLETMGFYLDEIRCVD